MKRLSAVMLLGAMVLSGAREASSWSLEVTVFEAYGDTLMSSISLSFGCVEGASDGFDPGLDVVAPPAPPGGGFRAYFVASGIFPELYKDMRAPADVVSWKLKVETSIGAAIAWNKEDVKGIASTDNLTFLIDGKDMTQMDFYFLESMGEVNIVVRKGPPPDTEPPTVQVISPNGGETLIAGREYPIRWIAKDNVGVTHVDLYYQLQPLWRATEKGFEWREIEKGLANTGSYPWKVPDILGETEILWMKIKVIAWDKAGNRGEDTSDRAFRVEKLDTQPPHVRLISPNGGEAWKGGSYQTIRWWATDNKGVSSVDLYYSTNGGLSWALIRKGLKNVGSYLWKLPEISTERAKVKVVVWDKAGNKAEDISDRTFRILGKDTNPPSVRVISPNGGENLKPGGWHSIRWVATDDRGVSSVELYYSTNGGLSWILIRKGLRNTGSYFWRVPDVTTTRAKVKVVAWDQAGNKGEDTSDRTFTIEAGDTRPPYVRVISPNGGENWKGGSYQRIRWWATDNKGVSSVDLYYSTNGGLSWILIRKGLRNTGSYFWRVPDVTTTRAKVKVVAWDQAGNKEEDTSDRTFRITGAVVLPKVTIESDEDTVGPGQDFWVTVNVEGTDLDILGMSFVIKFNPRYVAVCTPLNSNVTPGRIMGSDPILFYHLDEKGGLLSIGITKKASQGSIRRGGPVVKIKFLCNDSTPNGTSLVFRLSDLKGNDSEGNSVQFQTSGILMVKVKAVTEEVIVWPGDTNDDGRVDQADVPPIGLYWAKTGPKRPGASVEWKPQQCRPWRPYSATYADANGDGKVNQADVLVVGLNWGKEQGVAKSAPVYPAVPSSGMLRPVLDRSWFGPGEEVEVEVQVDGVERLFGASFVLSFSPEGVVTPVSVEVGDFLGDDLVFLSNTCGDGVAVGMSRKAGKGGVSGSGTLVRVRLRVMPEVPVGTRVEVSLRDVMANGPDGRGMSFEVGGGWFGVGVGGFERFVLLQNRPNPFNPRTEVGYILGRRVDVRLDVLDLCGRLVRVLVDEVQGPGRYSVVWDGRDDDGREVSAGVYVCRLVAGGLVQSRKMVLVR